VRELLYRICFLGARMVLFGKVDHSRQTSPRTPEGLRDEANAIDPMRGDDAPGTSLPRLGGSGQRPAAVCLPRRETMRSGDDER
jgi:hypothetical protein